MDEKIKAIKEWMAGGKDFAIGLELLKKVCRNKNVIDWINRKGERQDTRDKIEYELSKVIPVEPVEEKKEIPAEILAMKERLAFIGNRRSEVHRLMEELGDSNEADVVAKRLVFVEEIETLTSEYNEVDTVKEEYFATGKLPVVKLAEGELTDAQKVTRLNNLRATKSKWIKKDQADKKVQARILELQNEIDILEPVVTAILGK